MTRDQWRDHHARMVRARRPRGPRPKPRGRPALGPPPCHPDRAYRARGMCGPCYWRWYALREQLRQDTPVYGALVALRKLAAGKRVDGT